LNLRRKIYKQIEEERAKGIISNPLEANVEAYLPDEDYKVLKMVDSKLSDILITSSANYHPLSEAPEESKEVEGIKVVITRAKGEKCARCWQIKESVGKDEEYPDLCERCASILRNREIKPC
jgi:isoleucyl-tRNA synthetase